MDEEKLREYIGLFHKSVYRLAYSYVRNEAEAEDICQEAFIRLYEHNGGFDSDNGCRAWLFRVTINLSLSELRKFTRNRTVELDESLPAEEKADYGLAEAVAKLPAAYRTAIHLFYYEDCSVKEIARITRSTVSAVTTRLNRARKMLREYLENGS